MSNVIDLQQEREINALIDQLGQFISVNPDIAERTFATLFHFQFYSEAIIQGQATMEWTR